MNDLDRILSVIENPTRRRILQTIVREPHYPLQLSKELGISQQSIVKNLDIMERNGMVVSYRTSNNIGPDRIFYRPNSEFTITIDMRNGMFETHLINTRSKEKRKKKKIEETEEFQKIRKKISKIDKQLKDLEKLRSNTIGKRNELIRTFLDNDNAKTMDYNHRNLLYKMLNNPDLDTTSISKDMGVNETLIEELMSDLIRIFNEKGDKNGQ